MAQSVLFEHLDVAAGVFFYERRFIPDHVGRLDRRPRVMSAWGVPVDVEELNRRLDSANPGPIFEWKPTYSWRSSEHMEPLWQSLLHSVELQAYGTWPILDQGHAAGWMLLGIDRAGHDADLMTAFSTQLSIVAELLIARRRVEDISRRDPLTGILNRRGLEHFLPTLCDETRATRRSLYVGILDIDQFKRINDLYGHAYGDKILTDMALTLHGFVQGRGIAARIGGDEYVLVLQADRTHPDSIRKQLLELFADKEYQVCVGIVDWNLKIPWKEILDLADSHMYERKRIQSVQ